MAILNARDETERPQIQNKPPTMVVTRQPNRLTMIPVTGPSAKINDSPIDPTHAVRSRVSWKYAIKTGKRIPKFNAVPSVSAMIIVEEKQTSHDQALSTRCRDFGRVIGEVTCEQLSFGLTCISCRALRYNEKFRHD